MQTWKNGESGGNVKKVIEQNFATLFKHLSHNILALSTEERELLGSDYLSNNLIVYDTTLQEWFKYNNGKWVSYSDENKEYTQTFSISDWIDNQIIIPFSAHNISNPTVQLLLSNENEYSLVFGGIDIDDKYNITLSTDLPFNGKVVIK